jgi:hypothetical protein
MAAGPLPREQHARERDTRRRQSDVVAVSPDGVARGPELEGAYGPDTVRWYDTWRRSAQAQLFTDTDWGRLRILAPIVELYFRRPTAAALGEIRLNEERLGATYTDRLRAKIRVETGPVALSASDDAPRAPVSSIADRLRRQPPAETTAPF